MVFESGDFVVYYDHNVPIHAIVIQQYKLNNYNKYIQDTYIISPCGESYLYVKVNESQLYSAKLTMDQKLYILNSLGKKWFMDNKKLFQKALTN